MTKNKRKRHNQSNTTNKAPSQIKKSYSRVQLFKPEPVLTTGTDYQKVWYDVSADYYTLPIDRLALTRLVDLNAAHGGILHARKNMVLADYIGGGLSYEHMEASVSDYFCFGDHAILKIRNGWGDVCALEALPGLYTRLNKNNELVVLQDGEPLIYPPEDFIFHRQYDPQQRVYGKPDYIGGIHSAMLNSEATIFRRRYYNNGGHTGGIIYTNDPNLDDEMEDEIKSKIEDSKGVGNFKTMFVHIPKGGEKAIQFIPIGEISAKDEHQSIKTISEQDVFTAHRFPAGLGGIIPNNGTIMPDSEKARTTYRKDETIPVQKRIMAKINNDPEIPPELHVKFHIETKVE